MYLLHSFRFIMLSTHMLGLGGVEEKRPDGIWSSTLTNIILYGHSADAQ